MNSLQTTLTSHVRNARLVLPLLTIGIASLTIADAQTAQTTTPPYAEFQNATITGFGNTINIGWLPIQLSNGLAFKNVSITFDVDSSGNLTIASGFPQVSAAPPIPVTEFVVGTYTANSIAGNAAIVVNGPGVTSAGAAAWSLSIAPSGNCNTYPASAQWYVGAPNTLPILARLEQAGITSTAWSYGIGASSTCTLQPFPTSADLLLGFMQIGNSITIANFTDSSGKDHNQPLATVTYTLNQ